MKKNLKKISYNVKGTVLVFLIFLFLCISCTSESAEVVSTNADAQKDPVPNTSKALSNADKASGIKLFSFVEVNDTNPLNNLNFTLKNSGKPLVDIVVLFSANINYDAANDKVYVHKNPNIEYLLTNHNKYLKPLRDNGIKVLLSIMGNWDISGIASLSPERSKLFAEELKKTCEMYDLDGVFFDDEYSEKSIKGPMPLGFVVPSTNAAAARLTYETKKAMPDKLVTVYVYTKTASFPDLVDGVQAGNFVDYAIHDYGNNYDLSNNYPGLPKSRMALSSQEFNLGRYSSAQQLKDLRKNGYGAHMIFAMDPKSKKNTFATKQLPAMRLIAKELYDDELVYLNKPYSKDW